MDHRFESVAAVREGLAGVNYLADAGIAGVVHLADRLGKPVLVEGPAGTGKTQLAKSVAELTGARLIRLQCYEGLDESKALYEWNYKKQLLRIQSEREADRSWSEIEEDIFSEDFLLTRPLLEAIRAEDPVVLLSRSCRTTRSACRNWARSRPTRSRSSSSRRTTPVSSPRR
jgi:MoxR-like ATPase